jgi:short-subunit dehydrogenase
MGRRSLTGMRIVLTGASSGIGEAMARQLHERGARLLVTARREDRLKRLQAELQAGETASNSPPINQIEIMAGDLTEPAFRAALVEWCRDRWGAVDILVNNAGAGAIGPFAEATTERLRGVMEIDFFAPVELTRRMLPLLKRGTRPAILNIGSVLGHRAVPLKSEYCAAKFALRGWSEALRCELAGDGVEVLQVSPSTTRSEFFDSLIDTSPDQPSRSWGSMSPERVAELAIASLVRSRRDSILSWGGKGLVWLSRLFPSLVDRILSRRGG